MPNLNQIYALKERFFELNQADNRIKDYIEKTEAKDVLIKAFESRRMNESINETRFFSFINENLNPSRPDLIKYFEEEKEEDVALLFVDITSFSKTISGWSNSKIKFFLDDYYRKIIPLIYKNGGEIEKLMGDGIIIVFGKPFLNLPNPEYVYKAEICAEEVIKVFFGTDKNIKVAIHKGKINYYKVPGEHYGEYTMIGQPITDLYRLESVSKSNAVNYYKGSLYDKLGWENSKYSLSRISFGEFEVDNLQGVDFKAVRFLRFPGYF